MPSFSSKHKLHLFDPPVYYEILFFLLLICIRYYLSVLFLFKCQTYFESSVSFVIERFYMIPESLFKCVFKCMFKLFGLPGI